MKITTLVEKETDVKTLYINLHLRDDFNWALLNSEWEIICSWEDDYVPNDLVPWEFWDYMELKIDIESWKILNRPTLTPDKLKKIIADARWEDNTEE